MTTSGSRRLRGAWLVAAILIPAMPPVSAQSPDAWDAEIEAVIREGLRLNFEGRFDAADEIWRQLRYAYPDHPAASLYAGETLFWRQLYDLFDRRLDPLIEETAERAAAQSRDWLAANPQSARAALFVGQAEIQLGRLDGLVKRYYAAGRHAERAQKYLELALDLDPALADARYWLGLYKYYASTLQDVIQLLSWLWFIPEPDGPGGLGALKLVSESDGIHRQSAHLALMNIYTYYESDYHEAERYARALNAQFPSNSLIHFELVRILHRRGDFDGVIDEALRLESHPGSGDLDRGRALMARVWRARATLDAGRPDEAARVLAGVDESAEAIPSWGHAWIHLLRGRLVLAAGESERALELFEKAIDVSDDSPVAGRQAREEIEALK